MSGAWRLDYFSSSKDLDDDEHLWDGILQLKAQPEFTDTLEGAIEWRLVASVEESSARGRLLEGFFTQKFEHADLHVGAQIVAWGRADGINPTDNLSPRDYTIRLPFEADQRFGTTVAKLDVYASQTHTVTVVAAPFFKPSLVPLPDVLTQKQHLPPTTLSKTQTGLKLNKVGEGLDWSLSYFRGFSLSPSVRQAETAAESPVLALTYDRITAVGADFARNFGRFGIRGEAAYVDTSDDRGTDPITKNPSLFWIAGVDRTFYENLNVNAQFFQRRIRRHRKAQSIPDPSARANVYANSIFNGQRDPVSNGLTFRVSNLWINQTLEAEIFGVLNLTSDDKFIRAVVTYAFNDQWKATMGGEYYRGRSDTHYGSLRPNKAAFFEARYGF